MAPIFTKPGLVPRINWAHPLARDLVACVVPEHGEILTGTPPTLLGSGSIATALQGRVADSPATTTSGVVYALPARSPLYTIARDFSWAVFATVRTVASYSTLLSVPYRSGSWTNPYYAFAIARNATDSQARLCYAAYSWSLRDLTGASGSGYFAASSDHVMLSGGHAASGAVRFFKDGRFFEAITDGDVVAVDWTNRQPLSLLNRSDSSAGEGVDGSVSLALVWRRVLSDAEHAALAANPLAILGYGDRPEVGLLVPQGAGGTAYQETGSLATGSAFAGVDVFSGAETGALASGAAVASADALAAAETGSLASSAALSGSEAAALVEVGSVASAGSVSASDAAAFTETGSVASAAELLGEDVFSGGAAAYVETGAISSVSTFAGADVLTATETGTLASLSALSGADVASGATSGPFHPDLTDLEDLLALERPRAPASESLTFAPAWTGLTEVGDVTKSGEIVTVGDLVVLTATIESAGGTSAAVAGSTYLALPVPERAPAAASAADVTALAGLASGVITAGRLYVPTWAATTDTIVITATYRRA